MPEGRGQGPPGAFVAPAAAPLSRTAVMARTLSYSPFGMKPSLSICRMIGFISSTPGLMIDGLEVGAVVALHLLDVLRALPLLFGDEPGAGLLGRRIERALLVSGQFRRSDPC